MGGHALFGRGGGITHFCMSCCEAQLATLLEVRASVCSGAYSVSRAVDAMGFLERVAQTFGSPHPSPASSLDRRHSSHLTGARVQGS